MKRIECKNEDGVIIGFDYDFEPFFLVACDGITSVTNNVNTSANTMIDGSTYQGGTTAERNILITAQMDSNYQQNRQAIYRAFKPKACGTLYYNENGITLSTDYIVENVEIGATGAVRDITISLICPDPFFKALDDVVIDMAAWDGCFEFEHEFIDTGEEFGRRVAEQIKATPNESAAANTGITITFKAESAVINPALYHLESGDYIRVLAAMEAGDEIMITTETNNKNAYLLRDGIKTGINGLLDEDSEFIQLTTGDNTLRYDADGGLDYLNTSIAYRKRYLGV